MRFGEHARLKFSEQGVCFSGIVKQTLCAQAGVVSSTVGLAQELPGHHLMHGVLFLKILDNHNLICESVLVGVPVYVYLELGINLQ